MFCYKCGKQLPDDAMFCSSCGTAVQNAPASQPIPAVEPVQSAPEKSKKEKKPEKEKKPMDPKKKKSLMLIFGSLVLLAAVIGGICLYLQNHDVADIPDPEYYFGELGEVEIEDYGYAVSYLIRSETDLADATRAYYELVTSVYPFELKNEKVDDDGDVTYELCYNGDGYIWNRSIYQEIDIDYFGNDYSSSDERYVSGVWISRPKNFNIAEREQYDGSVSGAPDEGGADDFSIVSIPDLAHYFSAQNQSEEENEARFTFDTDPRDAVRYYVELLQNKYSVVLAEVYEDDGAGEWVLHHKDDPDAPFTIWVDRTGDGTWEVICRLHIFVIQMDWEVWEWPNAEVPAPEPEPEPQPTQQPTQQPASKPSSSDPSVIPNFLDCDASGKFRMLDESRIGKVVYKADSYQLKYVAEDYMKLLADLGYTIVYEYDKVYTNSIPGEVIKRDFYHSGVDADAVEKSDSNGQIRVQINTYEKWDETHVAITYSDGITVEGFDGGTGGGSSGSGSSSSSNHLDSRRPCNICGRTGDCQTCGGDGYLWSSANDKQNRNCYSCSQTGNCRTCHGTGWID